MKKIYLIYIVTFLLGVFAVQLAENEILEEGYLSNAILQNMARTREPIKQVWIQLCFERGKLFLCFWFLVISRLRKYVEIVLPFVFWGMLGIFAGICIESCGAWGICIFIFSTCPHVIFYYMIAYCFIHKKKSIQYPRKKYIFMEIVSIFLFIAAIAATCFLEAVMNQYILRNYLLAFISATS